MTAVPKSDSAEVTATMFRDAFRRHPGGIAIITADHPDGPVAITVTSLISVSAEPPAVAFSLSASSRSAQAIRSAGHVVVHFVRISDRVLAERCASPRVDRFASHIPWTRLPTGEPRFTSVETWFRAKLTGEMDVHGSTLVVAEPVEGRVAAEALTAWSLEEPLVYVDRQWRSLGNAINSEQPVLLWGSDNSDATF